MNTDDDIRVLWLEAPNGPVQVLTLAEAAARGGIDPAPREPLALTDVPALGAALRARGAAAVLVTGIRIAGDPPGDWLDTAHARGWIEPASGLDATTLAAGWQAALAVGHVPADAALLAWPALPRLTWGEAPAPHRLRAASDSDHAAAALDPAAVPLDPAAASLAPAGVATAAPLGLYAIVDTVAALRRVLEAGVRTLQLRVKRPADADAAWHATLRASVRESVAAAADHGALLFVNDHWRLAAELGAAAVHLGQEDLLALGEAGRAELCASGLALGVSSHAVWELCRARSLAPRYIACGPVWPTTTKAMPWRPQGMDNLAWWCRTAGAPVVAIGGILTPEQVTRAAACGASGVCVLRGLGDDPRLSVAGLQRAFEEGRQEALAQADSPVQADARVRTNAQVRPNASIRTRTSAPPPHPTLPLTDEAAA